MLTDKAIDLLIQIPLAGVIIIVVYIFLKFIEKSEIRHQQLISHELTILDADVNAIKEVTIEHNALMLAAVNEMRAAISRRAKSKTE
jgi:hypothetical protein